ncbi:MAG: hypothetical protein QM758_06035 [Armatimonas sp.]
MRIEKSDTLVEVLNKLSQGTKKDVIIDGRASNGKLAIEGDFTQDSLIARLKETIDYDFVVKEDAILLFKAFYKPDTRPDYSLAEIIASLKDIKAILTPVMAGRTGQEIGTSPFVSAVKDLGPEQAKQLQTEQGILIGSLDAVTQSKITEAIYFKEYAGVYRELNELMTLIDKMDSLTIAKSDRLPVIEFRSPKGEFYFALNASGLARGGVDVIRCPRGFPQFGKLSETRRPRVCLQAE